MTSETKIAYRHLLYCALLEIRMGRAEVRWWNPADWSYALGTLPKNKRLADDFHNLAYYSRDDFKSFSEEIFWSGLKRSSEAFHEKYRRIFDSYLRGEYQLV